MDDSREPLPTDSPAAPSTEPAPQPAGPAEEHPPVADQPADSGVPGQATVAGRKPTARKRPAAKKASAEQDRTAQSAPAAKRTAAKEAAPAKQAPAKKAAASAAASEAAAATAAIGRDDAATAATGRPDAVAAAATATATATEPAAKKAAAKKAPAKKAPAKRTPARTSAPAAGSAARGGRDFDIVVFVATGFVGRLVAEYLAVHAPDGVSIALAGRSEPKLSEVREQIAGAAHWPLIVADTADDAALRSMAARTRVLLTTVGPYATYGLPVVAACAEQGTHYLDLTGEVLFMRRSIDAYDAVARASGARIIHSCGFDSIPSDLGVFALHLASLRDGDGGLGDTRLGVVSARGGFSGGTVASMFAQLELVGQDRSLGKVAADPYALSPDRGAEPSPGDGRDSIAVGFDHELRSWVSPFLMAGVNTRVVRRSNALLDFAYSRDFRYREVLANGRGPQGLALALAITGGMSAGYAALAVGPMRSLAQRALPKPGEGPDEETRRTGRFAVRLVSRTPDGRRYSGLVAAQGDPGYAATAMMISQCALTLVQDADRLPDRAGALTPATGLGAAAIARLTGAGMTIEAERS